ncbi:MAG: hypothetical protein CMJ32_09180 [Phycisphaerae bacterium]|nr:hypothetical protein [Phycisphaerae bacterium]
MKQQGDSKQMADKVMDFMAIGKAIFLIITSCISAIIGWFIMGRLAQIAADHDLVVSGLSLMLLKNPGLIGSLALPGIGCGILLLTWRRYRILISTVGTLSLVALLGVVVFTIVSIVGPLYGG